MVRVVSRMTVLRFGALTFTLDVIAHDVETAHHAAAEGAAEDTHVRAVVPEQSKHTSMTSFIMNIQ